jgi:hypothetical protein
MPIVRHTDHPKGLTCFTATGAITLQDILEILNTFQDEPPAINILWDFTRAEVGDSFTADDFEKTAIIAKSYLGIREGGKTAFVASTDIVFGLIRMYTAYLQSQEIAHQVDVFRTLDNARQWLSGDTD